MKHETILFTSVGTDVTLQGAIELAEEQQNNVLLVYLEGDGAKAESEVVSMTSETLYIDRLWYYIIKTVVRHPTNTSFLQS